MKPAPLTPEQIEDIDQSMCGHRECVEPFTRAIEAAVNEQWQEMMRTREPVAWVDLLKEAEEIVRGKFLWKKFIDGTPLANDIPCWMADFGQTHRPPPPDHTAVMRQADKALGLIVQWHEAGFALTDHFVVRAKAAIAALKQALGEGE